MSPSATLMYGYPIGESQLPDGIQSEMYDVIHEKYGLEGRYALAAWILLNEDPATEINPWGDTVFDLHEKSGIWIEQYGEGVFLVTAKHLWHTQYGHGYTGIQLIQPTDADRELLARYAVALLDSETRPGWYLAAESD